MDDTGAEVRRSLRDRYARLSGAERMRIASEMFDSARTLARASFPAGLTEVELRRRLCERFYGVLARRVYPET